MIILRASQGALPCNSGREQRLSRSSRDGERGVVLILVLLVLVVLTAIGFLSLYSVTMEFNIDAAYKNRGLARNAAETGANIILDTQLNSLVSTSTLNSIPDPNGTVGTGSDFNLGTTRKHKAIGLCTVLQGNCMDASSSLVNEDTMCCFRMGPFFNYQAGQPVRPQALSDISASSSLVGVPRPVMLDIPGNSNLQYSIMNFYVTGGGPMGSLSVIQVAIKKGPFQKRGGSGTMYGSATGANL